MAPFSGFVDFQDCVDKISAQGKTADEARAICGQLQSQAEGKVAKLSWDSVVARLTAKGIPKEKAVEAAVLIKLEAKDTEDIPKEVVANLSAVLMERFVKTAAPFPPQQKKQAPFQKQQDNTPNPPSPPPQQQQQQQQEGELPFGGYGDFEACLADQINSQGLQPEAAVKQCSQLLLDYIKQLRDQQKQEQGQPNPPQQPGQQNQGPPQGKVLDAARPRYSKGKEIAEKFQAPQIEALSAMEWDQCVSQAGAIGADDAEALCGWLRFNGPNAKLSSGAIVSRTTQGDTGRFFIKVFLLDASQNINQWGVTPASLEANIGSFIGKPLVLMEGFNHPNLSDMRMDHASEYQELFRIGNIIDIAKKGDVYYAIVEITNPAAKKSLSSDANFPIYVSPAIAKLNGGEPDSAISQWTGMHVAIVDDPAYTVHKATITGQCGGDKQTCLLQLKKAHVEKHGVGNCGFCITGTLHSALPKIEITGITGQETREQLFELAETKYAELKNKKIAEVFPKAEPPTIHVEGKELAEQLAEQVLTNKTIDIKNPNNTFTAALGSNSPFAAKLASAIPDSATTDEKANSSHDNSEQKSDSSTSMSNVDNTSTQQPQNTSGLNNQPNSTAANIPQQVVQQQQTQQPVNPVATNTGSPRVLVHDEMGFLQAEFAKLKARNDHLEQKNASLEQENRSLRTDNDRIMGEYRRSAFERIITAEIIPDPQKRQQRIQEFLQTQMTPEMLESIYRDIRNPTANTTNNVAPIDNNNTSFQFTNQPRTDLPTFGANTYGANVNTSGPVIKNASVASEKTASASEGDWLELRSRTIKQDRATTEGGVV